MNEQPNDGAGERAEETPEAVNQADGYAEGEEPSEEPAADDFEEQARAENESGGDDRWTAGWGSFAEIQDAVSGLVDSAIKTVAPATGRFPRYDLLEVPDEGYVILFDLPGLEKQDVDVKVGAGEVSVEGTRPRPSLPEGATAHRSERTYGRFRRSVTVPSDVDSSGISAKMSNGVLEIRLPRTAPGNEQQIRVD